MEVLEVFIKNMKKYRTEKKLSQEDLADKAGLHRTYISSVERGQRNVSLKNIGKIAKALEIEVYKLFMEE